MTHNHKAPEKSARFKQTQLMIWHYTNLTAFASIVEGCSLRATDIRYLSDTRELHSGKGQLDGLHFVFDEALSDIPHSTYIAFMDAMRTQEIPGRFYVVCFSAQRDDAMMWMSHAGSRGVALGFDEERLHAYSKKQAWELAKVHYGGSEHREILDASFFPALRKVDLTNCSEERKQDELAKLVKLYYSVSPRMKDHQFRSENEWRLIFPSSDTPSTCKVLVRGDMMIPYVEFALPEGPDAAVAEIMIGPGREMDKLEQTVKTLVEAQWGECAVTQSEIGMRRWT